MCTPHVQVFSWLGVYPTETLVHVGKDMYEDLLYKTGYSSRKLIHMLWNAMWVFKVMRLDFLRL